MNSLQRHYQINRINGGIFSLINRGVLFGWFIGGFFVGFVLVFFFLLICMEY